MNGNLRQEDLELEPSLDNIETRDISAGGRREGWLKPLGKNPKSLN